MDGIWKLRHPHCMFPVKAEVNGMPTLNYPSVCTLAPETQSSAFCVNHAKVAKENHIPTKLRDFVHDYCDVPRKSEGES